MDFSFKIAGLPGRRSAFENGAFVRTDILLDTCRFVGKNVFVERNSLELKGTHIGWTCPQVKEMVQAALGGCLFLDEAYALSGGGKDGDRGDSFSDEALRTLLTETENNRSSLCVVLAGSWT